MNLEEAVAALGETEESICQVLREKGIKGRRRQSWSCPIAKFFQGEGLIGAEVSLSYAYCDFFQARMILPYHVTIWIRKFDRKEYPEFLEVA